MQDSRSATSGLVTVGVIVVILGVLSAVGLWYSAGQRYDDAVRNLARAPVGCVTTLDFAETGRYLLFIETRGTIDDVVGDCGAPGDFEFGGGARPDVDVTLVDPRDATVGFDPVSGPSYDAVGSEGRAVQSFEVDTAGDHLLTVADAEPGFAVAIGRDPNDGVALLRIGAGLALASGLLIGGAMFLLASRRSGPHRGPGTGPPTGWSSAPPGRPVGGSQPPIWRPVSEPPVRPPTTAPIPGQPPLDGGPVAPPAPPGAGPTAPPVVPAPDRPHAPDDGPPGATRPLDTRPHESPGSGGGSGDGEQSPWAPPPERGR